MAATAVRTVPARLVEMVATAVMGTAGAAGAAVWGVKAF